MGLFVGDGGLVTLAVGSAARSPPFRPLALIEQQSELGKAVSCRSGGEFSPKYGE